MIECEIILDKFGERVVDKKAWPKTSLFTKVVKVTISK
jgi:hypothetical protein